MKKLMVLLCVVLSMAFCLFAVAEDKPVLSLNNAELTLLKGKTSRLIPSIPNVENSNKLKFTWESSDPSVATVSGGTVKAVDAGNAIITCSTVLEDENTVAASANVTVTVPVSSVKLISVKDLTVNAGQTAQVDLEISPENATDKTVEWSSSDSAVASVDANGLIMGVSAGKAVVTATAKDGSKKKAQTSVYVPSLRCETDTVELDSPVEKSVILNYYGSNWADDVTITAKGDVFDCTAKQEGTQVTLRLSPLSAGNGTLTITDKKDKKSEVTIDVHVATSAIPINKYVVITKASGRRGNRKETFKNNTDVDIGEVTIVSIPYNQFDEQVYENNGNHKNVKTERRYMTFSGTLKPGKTAILNSYYPFDGGIANTIVNVDVAVDSLRLKDGTKIKIADTDHYWFSSEMGAYRNNLTRIAVDTTPEKPVLEQADDFQIGYMPKSIPGELAEHYGYHYPGLYVDDVVAGTISEAAGLKVHDLIVAVDGIKWADDPYCAEKGKAKLASGESVVFTVERYGQKGTIDLVFKPN